MIKNRKIVILENIQVDKTLPKHVKETNNTNHATLSILPFDDTEINGNSFRINFTDEVNLDAHLEYLKYRLENSKTLRNKLKLFLYKKIYARTFHLKVENIKTASSVLELQQFFNSIKSTVTKLDSANIKEILSKYESILTAAESNRQIALTERLKDYSEMLKYELILSTSEFNKYLDEEDVVKFYDVAFKHEKYKTGLCLTYIKNFIKIIPAEVSELKLKADALKVFDNYVILHYDYSGKAVDDTKAEKEKKRDPILFGVIKNSNRLYYIGDWIDDYCDLTLDVLIKTIGIPEKELNKETIIDGLK